MTDCLVKRDGLEAVPEPMTVAWVTAQVERMATTAASPTSSDVALSALETQLRRLVFTTIAKGGCEDPQGCCAAALKTDDLEFWRYSD
jgi:hypothetical protein